MQGTRVVVAKLWATSALFARLLLGLFVFGSASAGTSDLTGPWNLAAPINALKTEQNGAPPLTAVGQTLYLQNQTHRSQDPIKRCLPPGVPRAMMQSGFPFSIVGGKTLVGMMIEWNHLPRVIYLDREHFDNLGPAYLGQSVGHWDGSTLVVDTTGYNDATWLDNSGLPHSSALHTVERIRRLGQQELEDRITFEDPTIFSYAWTAKLTFRKVSDPVLKEDYCFARMGIDIVNK